MDERQLSMLMRPEGWALLNSLPPYQPDKALVLTQELRDRGLDTDLVTAAMTQSRLRAKARGKFGEFTDGMLFTEVGIEQATRLSVGAHHAARYQRAGIEHVADLGCGIGADAMAMSALGIRVSAIESDESTAALAMVNLRFFPDARVLHADINQIDLAELGAGGVYADPARRSRSGKRIFDPSAYSPPLATVLELAGDLPTGIKVGPGIDHRDLPEQAQAQWVSVDGDVVECGLWFGPLIDPPCRPGMRTALVLRGDQAHHVRPTSPDAPPVGELGSYLYEPDGAVIRAHLVAEVAAATGGRLLNRTIAYVTSDERHDLPYATGYRVLDSMPFQLKRLRAYLRERNIGPITIKKRGTAVTPEQLRTQLALTGSKHATIVLTRIGKVQSVIVVEPL